MRGHEALLATAREGTAFRFCGHHRSHPATA